MNDLEKWTHELRADVQVIAALERIADALELANERHEMIAATISAVGADVQEAIYSVARSIDAGGGL